MAVLGNAARVGDNLIESEALLKEAGAVARDYEDDELRASVCLRGAYLTKDAGQLDDAFALAVVAGQLYMELAMPKGVAQTFLAMGHIRWLQCKDPTEQIRAALSLFGEDDWVEIATARQLLAEHCTSKEAALQHLDAALELCPIGSRLASKIHWSVAGIYLETDQDLALSHLQIALDGHSGPLEKLMISADLAQAHMGAGRREKAKRVAAEAMLIRVPAVPTAATLIERLEIILAS